MRNYCWMAAVSAAALLVCSCGNDTNKNEGQERAEIVETTVLKTTEVTRVVNFSTTLQGYQTMNVAPSITGKIEKILVDVGSNIEQGTLLVRMDRNQYNTTKLTYANLGVELGRLKALLETGAVSQQSYDQAKLSYDQTKESLDFLETNTFFRAPFRGVISAKNYEDGELYSGQPILVLTQLHVLKALINVPESYFPLVKEGMKLTVESEIYPEVKFPAVIEIVYPTIDTQSHTFQCKLRIPNANRKLRPGMYVHTTMNMNIAKAFMVPYSAVLKLTGANDRYIFLEKDGVAQRVFVTCGQRVDDAIEILEVEPDTIKEGDKIVTLGQSKLVDGSKLNVVNNVAKNE